MVFIFARPCAALLHISMRVISMSAHVSYETPNDVADKIYEMVSANKNGKMKKGSPRKFNYVRPCGNPMEIQRKSKEIL